MDPKPSTHVRWGAGWAVRALGTDPLCGARPYCFGHLAELCNARSPNWQTLRGHRGAPRLQGTQPACAAGSLAPVVLPSPWAPGVGLWGPGTEFPRLSSNSVFQVLTLSLFSRRPFPPHRAREGFPGPLLG